MLAGPITFSGLGLPLTSATNILPVDIYAAGISGQSPSDYSGITRIMNTSVLPTTTRLGVSNGLYDFGALNLTLGSVTFYNDQDFFAFDPATGTAGIGITGTGTLRVTGDINVLGNVSGFNSGSNAIATNLDFGGGTQVFRVSSATLFAQVGGVANDRGSFQRFAPQDNGFQPERGDERAAMASVCSATIPIPVRPASAVALTWSLARTLLLLLKCLGIAAAAPFRSRRQWLLSFSHHDPGVFRWHLPNR